MNDLLHNIDHEFNTEDIDFNALERAKKYINDKDYFNFITEKTNGGYFYSSSLHIYGYCFDLDYHSIENINKILKTEFKDIIGNSYSFGQDIFGNQFVYSEKGIEMFNIESGDREVLASNFKAWMVSLESDVEYFTGRKFAGHVVKVEKLLNTRLCPKKPFVIGGEYKEDNLYPLAFPDYIYVNANIARQVFNLPDGADIKLITSK